MNFGRMQAGVGPDPHELAECRVPERQGLNELPFFCNRQAFIRSRTKASDVQKRIDASLPVSVDVADVVSNRRRLAVAQIEIGIFPRGKIASRRFGTGIQRRCRESTAEFRKINGFAPAVFVFFINGDHSLPPVIFMC